MKICQTNIPEISSSRCGALMVFIKIFLLIFIFQGCSGGPGNKDAYPPVEIKPFWLKGPDFVTPRTTYGDYEVHSFFDPVPFSDRKSLEMNVVINSIKGSAFDYNLDTQSGKLYRQGDMCLQDDVWKKFRSSIYRFPVTEAHVPRLLDQLGYPQKVIVFGESKYFPDYDPTKLKSYRVRIVGGILDQYCDFYPCGDQRKWLSRLLLIAVNPRDPRFFNSTSLRHVMEKENWPRITAFLENYRGRSLRPGGAKPAYRLIGELEASEAFQYAFSEGFFFQMPQMRILKQNCWKLYDYTWRSMQEVRKNQKKSVDDIVKNRDRTALKQLEQLFSSNVIDDSFEVDLEIDDLLTVDFSIFFRYWYLKYSESYLYCRRYLPAADHKVARDRHWSLDFLWMFLRLEELGYVYSCSKKAWINNPVSLAGRETYDLKEMKASCTTSELDHAFLSAPQFLESLALNNLPHIRYIEYDTGHGGSHERIFSWVDSFGKKLACKDSVQRKAKTPVFPQDVVWNSYRPDLQDSIYINVRKEMRKRDLMDKKSQQKTRKLNYP